MLQRLKFKTIIYAVIFVNLLVLLGFGVYWFSAQARDYRRLADLKVWQNILADYYLKNGSYVIPDCGAGKTLSSCLVQKRGRFLVNNINDPLNRDIYRYVVGDLSETDYQINFSLEAGIGGLPPGTYILTKNGVKQ